MDVLTVYTDGGCDPNPGKGGWGVVIVRGDDIVAGFNGSDSDTTNNRMEIMAVIASLEYIAETMPNTKVVLYSDSQYVINTMTKGWKKNKNGDLWDRLGKVVTELVIDWKWVKGHNGVTFNEVADLMATDGIAGNVYRYTR